ncbi:MAG: pyridoxal-phosphate dependent enzyme [Planctomycetota bacterium]|nr:MAG: pyridoxal-phosphate dependent enzyme [Planctomycetota bacterium]
MTSLGLEHDVVDEGVYSRAVERFRATGARLPTFAQLADPARIPAQVAAELAGVDPDQPHALNLFRVHWYNGEDRKTLVSVPGHVVLGEQLTGVPAPIIVALGDRFPMIRAHKVLAAYACLAPRLVTGQFDPGTQRAIWPSTGNYCRGGIAISKALGCHGVAVLPEGMSAERFRWLAAWVADERDVVRTPGSESNVKEIYDECARLAADPANVVLNQFCEFGNHLAHFLCTGLALERVFLAQRESRPGLRLAAFVSATGSAGTLAAGDHLKERFGSRTVAVEALECPTMLYNGFGEHNIQGIGDKHIPFIHNVTNTDVALAVSDRATDSLNLLFNTAVGREWLAAELALSEDQIAELANFGLSSLANIVAAIKVAKAFALGPDDAIVTVATDGAAMYTSELEPAERKLFPAGFDGVAAQRVFIEHLAGADTDHVLELDARDRDRIFNLGYFTWVEQQGVSLDDFERRRDQGFWRDLRALIPAWDARIEAFNRETGATDP